MIPIPLAMAGGGWKKLAIGLAVIITVGLLVAFAAWRGHRAGYKAADLERQAEVAAIHESHAHAMAVAESTARRQLEATTARTYELESQYLAAQRTIEKQSRELTNQRIIHASKNVDTADGSCRFGPEWVRLYNEAVGAGDGGDAVPVSAACADGEAPAAHAPQAGILPGAPTVTPEDILAHARDMGRYIRELEASLSTWIEWAAGLNAGEVVP